MIQRIQTEFIDIHRNLEHTICGSIDDRFAGRFMLIAEHFNDLCAGRRIVAETFHADGFLVCLHEVLRETVWIGLKRYIGRQTRYFPMPGGRVLALGSFRAFADIRLRIINCQIMKGNLRHVAPANAQQIRHVYPPTMLPNVSERVRARVAVFRRVRHRADAETVCYDQNHFFSHVYTSFGFASK